ncbi:hypothetical protein BU25DRAFT_254092 [Macroventuria anomochaeta]|uniref:Uncharacterized protein n=1 Tax=Macroventuria anomochaeta TaxID=301207 RepID=A0ACB6RGE6_9PLEO|nr:uncharacterized protein BU25DRAFT_254092 [Macroventuria anomochaeta]KAF2621066.1 hypothetical protein BU25DRAFT_254092 [Macroventuria anomochaeta]
MRTATLRRRSWGKFWGSLTSCPILSAVATAVFGVSSLKAGKTEVRNEVSKLSDCETTPFRPIGGLGNDAERRCLSPGLELAAR